MEEFSSTLNDKNTFCNDDDTRFFVIKRNDGGFNKTSPFLIQKSILSIIGEPKVIKKLRSGELLAQLQNNIEASNLRKFRNSSKYTYYSQCPQNIKLQ